MKKIFRFLLYIFYIIVTFFSLLFRLIVNLFSKKCKYEAKDIKSIDIFGGWISDPVSYTMENNSKVSKIIKEHNILKYKKYIIGNPFISFKAYEERLDSYDLDGFDYLIKITFNDGNQKKIEGYSKKIEEFIKDIETKR